MVEGGGGGANLTKSFEEILDREVSVKTIIFVAVFGELFENN
jgi:hypothetical protein